MRIDAYNQIAQLYGVHNKVKTTKAQNAGRVTDQVSISRAGRDYQVARKAVADASDVREDKVSQLKSMINAGTYSVSEGDFASKLLEKYNSLI